jgi:hypothetical protein
MELANQMRGRWSGPRVIYPEGASLGGVGRDPARAMNKHRVGRLVESLRVTDSGVKII